MDRERIEACLAHVRAYQASGLRAKVWAQANDVNLGALGSWCAHAARWQRRLDGHHLATPAPFIPSGFVPARMAASVVLPSSATATSTSSSSSSVRIELSAGRTRLELHWPISHASALAGLLRELSQ